MDHTLRSTEVVCNVHAAPWLVQLTVHTTIHKLPNITCSLRDMYYGSWLNFSPEQTHSVCQVHKTSVLKLPLDALMHTGRRMTMTVLG